MDLEVTNKPSRQVVSDEVGVSQSVEQKVEIWADGQSSESDDKVANETAVALVYNGVSHVVMMASPQDLEAFAIGFSLTEGIVERAEDIYEIHVGNQIETSSLGIEVLITISNQCFTQLKDKRRSMTGRTGCGICGAESLQQVRLPVSKVVADFCISHVAIDRATQALTEHQPLQAETGASHGAAWCDTEGTILRVSEDVGRHNALDKLIGKMSQQEVWDKHGFLLISSRASYEIVQKSAMAEIGIVAAVSAPTSMAIDIANQADITLIGFSRENRHVAYTNTHRLVP